ncbi:50S ribosomal protein L23 [Candidatus Azambacteria bacterium RIFCSPHIGHO2_02_FULL_52_12]|uniref:Large ribosomal subunit protein uL23 n=1 Tax=Candidatus Azambacteria bacterium RIFCSPLOWO2_01_FULL_46_25 TaxID=1797298 RepID=A0A1F5BUF1_9BACT|nr:MAG: 50S ribosomal protein L23 [Candidatus Azambacteria bacterium RIFCSPHIGHO2_02_FULL_52_12]OGD34224.1 MAG: 50S ribosomal protein L23 [Candidatus Azambacteria bacterium RIFCSPLOWO2_01_FULL_46_25]OGD36762.1 MAG: 50S ribosomal protein L23 [Candidatus Azambacteria bacterium RIFCSPHIGHO2_01_FULL_51_74]
MLLHPYVTEKAAGLKAAGNKYVFMVADLANKRELRKVIQEKFKVAVTKVNIINIPRKSIKVGRTLGSKPGFKKAIITLKEGNTIETGV